MPAKCSDLYANLHTVYNALSVISGLRLFYFFLKMKKFKYKIRGSSEDLILQMTTAYLLFHKFIGIA